MDEDNNFDHEWDIKSDNGLNVTENKLFESLKRIGLNPKSQYKIDQMTVDFAFPDDGIIVEINGPYHKTEEQILRDKRRLFVLHKKGWKRKTYNAESVYKNPDGIAKQIAKLIGKKDSNKTYTSSESNEFIERTKPVLHSSAKIDWDMYPLKQKNHSTWIVSKIPKRVYVTYLIFIIIWAISGEGLDALESVIFFATVFALFFWWIDR
ncbi:DUF559 domain-containing protein [Candidatus Woesearchaeota archaeon]|nr:DUF559 domain-containing protein [Candidatus Woesearchaeota archaeon]